MSAVAVAPPAEGAANPTGPLGVIERQPAMPLYAARLIARARAGAKASRLGFALGVAFGLVLVLARVHEYATIHDMLMLRDPYVYLLMGSAVGTAAPLLWLLQRRRWRTPFGGQLVVERQQVERRHIAGSVVFGAGWAITGACPAPALAMAASGNAMGGVVVGGLFVGLLLRDWIARHQGLPESPTC